METGEADRTFPLSFLADMRYNAHDRRCTFVEIGRSIHRVDAYDKVTGRAKYTDDLRGQGALVARILHSTIANGVVKEMDLTEAQKVPGVVKILTCFDAPDIQYPTPGHPWSVEAAHQDVADRKLLDRRVRIYGDDIAVVVAEDEVAAEHALKAIQVTYEEYPVYTEPEAAMAPGTVAIHDEHPDNILRHTLFDVLTPGAGGREVDEVFADPAYRHFEAHIDTQAVQHCHIENPVSYAWMEGDRIRPLTPDLRAAEHAVGASDAARQMARADFLPKLSGGANFNYTGEPLQLDVNVPGTDDVLSFEGRNTKYGASLNLSQPLYTGGALQAGYDKARGEDQIARQEVRRVTNDLRYEADVRYWNRVAQCELVAVADRYRTSVAQLVAVVRERVELEYTDRNDLLMAEVRLNDADYRSERARNEAEVARLSLNALAGIPSGE